NVLCLHAEYRRERNCTDKRQPAAKLLAALEHHGLGHLYAGEKDEIIKRILAGPPYTEPERTLICSYCRTDVDATELLLNAMLPTIQLKQALARGAFLGPVALMQHRGVPIDLPLFEQVASVWDDITPELVRRFGAQELFEDGKFKHARFRKLLRDRKVR